TAALATVPARRLMIAGTTAAILCGAWTTVFAHRWHLAGTLSQDLIRQLAVRLSAGARENGTPLYLAAVLDSYGGAYMLRTALAVARQPHYNQAVWSSSRSVSSPGTPPRTSRAVSTASAANDTRRSSCWSVTTPPPTARARCSRRGPRPASDATSTPTSASP